MTDIERWQQTRPSPGIAGDPASLGELYEAGREEAERVSNANARFDMRLEATERRIRDIEKATGTRLANPFQKGRWDGDRSYLVEGQAFAMPTGDELSAFQEDLRKLALSRPEHAAVIKPDLTPWQEAQQRTNAASRRNDEAMDTRGNIFTDPLAYGANFAGAFVGAFNDPVNIVANIAGGPGNKAKSILWNAVRQGAVNAAVQAALEPAVQSWRKEAGLEAGLLPAAQNVGFAFTFGAGLDAGGRTIARTGRSLTGRADGQGGFLTDAPVAPVTSTEAALDALEQAAKARPEGDILRRAAEGDDKALVELARGLKDDDPAVRGAIAEIEAAPDARLDRVIEQMGIDDGSHIAALAQAVRNAEVPFAEPPAPRVDGLPPAKGPSLSSDDPAPAARGVSFEVDGKPARLDRVEAGDIGTDAATFQYKSGGDAAGATDRLANVGRWDEIGAGKVVVFERMNGELVIADGHQRLALAKRLEREGKGGAAEYTAKQQALIDELRRASSAGALADDARTAKFILDAVPPPGSDMKAWRGANIRSDQSKLGPIRHAMGDVIDEIGKGGGRAKTIELDAYVLREADGWTPADVRALAAKKNLQEGSGTAIDAARILRERPDIADQSLPTTAPMLRQARALARLSDAAFARVVAGQAEPSYAALVADLVPDRDRHASILDDLTRLGPETQREARVAIGELLQAGTAAETQLTLLGAENSVRSLLPERIKVLDQALALLRQENRVFNALVREAGLIEAAGNRLSGDVNAARAAAAGEAEALIERLARTRGPVSGLLDELAGAVAAGKSVKEAARNFVARFQAMLDDRGLAALLSDDATPRPPTKAWDEPLGDGAKEQTDRLAASWKDADKATKELDKDLEQMGLLKLSDYFLRTGADDMAARLGATSIVKLRPWSKHPGKVLAFHGTQADFTKFDLGKTTDFGLHFGTPDQANKFTDAAGDYKQRGTAAGDGGRVMPVVLDLDKVVTLPDLGRWEPRAMLKELEGRGIEISARTRQWINALAETGGRNERNEAYRMLRQELTAQGIDGIRYLNGGEGGGLTWSYIVWEKGKVTSASAGDLLYSMRSTRRLTVDGVRMSRRQVEEQVQFWAARAEDRRRLAEQPDLADDQRAVLLRAAADNERWALEARDQLPRFDQDKLPRGRPFQPGKEIAAGDRYVVRRLGGMSANDETLRTYRIYPKQAPGGKGKGRPLGEVSLSQHPDGRWEVDMVEVAERHRGKGVAKALYNAVETDIGDKMRPSGILLPDGYAMWKARDPELVKYHVPFDGVYLSPKRLLQSRDLQRHSVDVRKQWKKDLEDGKRKPSSVDEPQEVDALIADAEQRLQVYDAAIAKLPPEATSPDALASMFKLTAADLHADGFPKLAEALVRHEVGLMAHLRPEGVRVNVLRPGMGGIADRIEGAWQANAATLHIALAALDKGATVRHELVHAYRSLGLLTDQEFRVLRAKVDEVMDADTQSLIDKEYRAAYGSRGWDAAKMADSIDEEKVAFLVEERWRRKVSFGKTVDAVLDRIIEVMERMQNALAGLGYQSFEDVIARIESGEVAARSRMRDLTDADLAVAKLDREGGMLVESCKLN